MTQLMIFFIYLVYLNPNKVIQGTWSNNQYTITISKIVGNTIYGQYKFNNKTYEIISDFRESIWDQPCSKAYESEFKIDKKLIKIQFVGYESQIVINDCLVCQGDLKGFEATIITKKQVYFLSKK